MFKIKNENTRNLFKVNNLYRHRSPALIVEFEQIYLIFLPFPSLTLNKYLLRMLLLVMFTLFVDNKCLHVIVLLISDIDLWCCYLSNVSSDNYFFWVIWIENSIIFDKRKRWKRDDLQRQKMTQFAETRFECRLNSTWLMDKLSSLSEIVSNYCSSQKFAWSSFSWKNLSFEQFSIFVFTFILVVFINGASWWKYAWSLDVTI